MIAGAELPKLPKKNIMLPNSEGKTDAQTLQTDPFLRSVRVYICNLENIVRIQKTITVKNISVLVLLPLKVRGD